MWRYNRLDSQADGRKRTAMVVGREEYFVSVESDQTGSLIDMQYNCPYAENGEYCKPYGCCIIPGILQRGYCRVFKKKICKKVEGNQKPKIEKSIDTVPTWQTECI